MSYAFSILLVVIHLPILKYAKSTGKETSDA